MARIAHVDDHETVRLGFSSLLTDESDLDLVLSTSTVTELLPHLSDVDLVVLDLRLSDGSSLTANLDALGASGVQILALTGADNLLDLRTASRAGVLGIV